MKSILSLLLLTNLGFAAPTATNEMQDLSKQFVTTIQDNYNLTQLQKAKEFEDCRKKLSSDSSVQSALKGNSLSGSSALAAKASECLANSLKGKSIEELNALSDNLKLTDYSLISSKNVKDISKYLGDKLYQSMTGIDPNTTDPKKLSFQNPDRKLVDQQDFFKLYKVAAGKAALLVISNYCYKDLRMYGESNESFGEHWKKVLGNKGANPSSFPLTDKDSKPFGNETTSADSKNPYTDMVKGLGVTDISQLGPFFNFCSQSIKLLCDSYKTRGDQTDERGLKACYVTSRLAVYKKDMDAVDKILQDPSFNDNGKTSIATNLKFFNGSGDVKMSDLTDLTASDVMSGGKDKSDTKAKDCAEASELPGCEMFLGNAGPNDTIYDTTSENIAFKSEIEKARIDELIKQKGPLGEYLKQNGYLDLTENSSAEEIKKAIDARFEAERLQTVKGLTDQLGARQTADDVNGQTDQMKLDAAKKKAEQSVEERNRLAQVVLFNNIITSQIEVSSQDSKGKVLATARNVGALRSELNAAKQSGADVSDKIFDNLQQNISQGGKSEITGNEDLGNITFIDQILGGPSSK